MSIFTLEVYRLRLQSVLSEKPSDSQVVQNWSLAEESSSQASDKHNNIYMQENKVESQGLNMSSITNKQVGRFVKSESSLVFKWLQIVKVLK